MSGYNEIRTLSPEEIAAIPILARGASMRFLATRLYDWLHPTPGALIKPLDTLEYLTRLKFHQKVNGTMAYGIAA